MSPRRPARRRQNAPIQSPAAWIAARARNALRRPVFISAVSTVTFAAALLALVIVPQQARKAATALQPAASQKPDTVPTVSALAEAQRQVASADAAIGQARADLAQLLTLAVAATVADTTPGGQLVSADVRNRRDTLTEQIASLARLIARSENAPLLGSYRALAQAPPLQGDPRVRPMLDSLVEIERERESYSAVGGVDPAFVALTARANELGRNIETLASARRSELQRELTALAPVPAPVIAAATPQRALPDTLESIRARDAARSVAAGVAARLAIERAELTRLDAREATARDLANLGASPSAMLAAALVFGAVLGFGAALFNEVRHPRVADAHEAERATGVRVLGSIEPLPQSPERGRRSEDRSGPPHIDPGADGHQLVYLTIATAGVDTVMLTITGDSPSVASIIAVNFAAIAADEARSTLLVDTDGAASSVSAALRLRASVGMKGVANGTTSWANATRIVRLGRDRSIDVVTSGEGAAPVEQVIAAVSSNAERLTRRYDAIVLVSAVDQVIAGVPKALPVSDVLFCVRAGQTSIAELKQSVAAITSSGANVRGLVLWNAPEPALADLRPAEEVEPEAVAVA